MADRRYFYDTNGIISSAKVYYYGYDGESVTEYDFYFRTNLQGDVLAVYNSSGTCLMEVTYDAWGNFTDTVSTMEYPPSTEQLQALAIPFRYRGYYYDQETGLYYLNSRYYDASLGRFINPDDVFYLGANSDINSYNLYAYCSNNPVMYVDINGNDWNSFWKSIGDWFSNTFGAGVVQTETYDTISVDTVFYGNETGLSTTKVITGNISKPVSVYATNASEWWKIWEYNVGVQVNIGEGGVDFTIGLEPTMAVSFNNTTYEIMTGVNKVGYTLSYDVDFGNRTAGTYYHEYVRTIPVASVCVAVYYGGVLALSALTTGVGAIA